jgi:PBP1b-binding outer membrane lipoprotein LpoB
MNRTLACLAGAALFAAACASVPPPKSEVGKADLAVNNAQAVNAAEIDPLDMRLAQEKLEKAKLEMKDEHYDEARRLAETAEVDAMVAEATARSTRAQQATQELQQEVNRMRSQTGKGGAQ